MVDLTEGTPGTPANTNQSSTPRDGGQARLGRGPDDNPRETANRSSATQREDLAQSTTERRSIPPPYVPTEECENGEDYQPPQTLLNALQASPAPVHPELKARRVSAMFAHHWDKVKSVRIANERQLEADRRRAEQERIEVEESNYPSNQFK